MKKKLWLVFPLIMLAANSGAVKPPFRVECCMGPGGYLYCSAPPNPYCEVDRKIEGFSLETAERKR